MIYLDSAATTLIKPPSVERELIQAMRTMASPGRGGHMPAVRASETVFKCREKAARLFGVENPENVAFTMNATHALNIAIFSLVSPGTKVLISGFEHNSVVRPLRACGAEITVAGRRLFDTQNVLDEFALCIPKCDLVICTHVSNVFGFILPVYEIAQICERYGVPFILDASQSAGTLDINMRKLNAAFIAMPGHKGLFGPQGTGILLCGREGKPLLHGGSGSDSLLQTMPEYMPDKYEAGTHNVSGIAGLMAGMEYVEQKGIKNIFEHERQLLGYLGSFLKNMDGIRAYLSEEENQSGVLSITSEYLNCEELAYALAEKGICVRAGLHCSPLAHESAGTIGNGTVRFSFSPFLSKKQMEVAAETVRTVIKDKIK